MQCVYWKLILAHTKNCTPAENSAMGWWLLSKQLCWHTGALDFMRGTLRPCMCKCRWRAHHLGNKRHSQRCLPSSCVQSLWKQRTSSQVKRQEQLENSTCEIHVQSCVLMRTRHRGLSFLVSTSCRSLPLWERGWKGAFAHVCAHSHSITSLCSFPIAAVTECCKFGSLKQYRPIISMGQNPGTASLCVPLVFCLESHWMKPVRLQGCAHGWELWDKSASSVIQVSSHFTAGWQLGWPQGLDTPTPWLPAPCLPLQSQHWGPSQASTLSTPLPATSLTLLLLFSDCVGPGIIQDHLPVWKSAD